jgi:hypothetical protein
MARRQKVTSKEIAEILSSETGRILGQDVGFLAHHMKVRRSSTGVPNWDAKLDLFAGAVIAEAFGEARDHAKVRYELE